MKSASDLRDEYLKLLDEKREEQAYQKFIEENTRLVPRDFVQNHGVQLSLVLRKLSFGADYKSDFFFLSKSSDDWNAVFIEIEKPASRFFRDGSHDFHPDFVHALQQINDWRAWLEMDGNEPAFLNEINTIRVPSTMARNRTYFKFVLVFGRRSEYQNSDLRRAKIRAQERDDFKIMTFDSLAEDLESKRDLYVGIRRNEFIDIQGNEIVSDGIFSWADPNMLTVSKALYKKLEAQVAANSTSPIRNTGNILGNIRAEALKVKQR